MMKFIRLPKHIIVAASSWGARFITACVQIVSIGIFIESIGNEGYAAFALLSGLAAWAVLFDFGVGSSLQNYISELKAEGKEYDVYIFVAFSISLILLLIVMALLYPISYGLSNIYLKNISASSITDKNISFYLSASIFVLMSMGSLLFKVWFAEQRGWLANILLALSSVLGLLLVYFAWSEYKTSSLNFIFLLFYGPAALISFVFLCVRVLRYIYLCSAPSLKEIVTVASSLIKRGRAFWFFTLIATIVLQADYIVMSQKLNSSEIVTYVLLMKIFTFISFFYSALLQALWPECVELRVKRQWGKLNSLVYRYIAAGCVLVITFTLLLFVFKSEIMSFVSKGSLSHVENGIIALIGLYFILRVWSDTYAMLHQSMNYLSPLWKLVPIQAVISLGLQWFLCDLIGLYGIVLGLILSFILTVVVFLPLSYNRKVKEYMRESITAS